MRLERASGIRSGIQQGAQLAGAPIGGLLVAGVGATNALWLDSASFLVSAMLVVFFVPRPATHAAPEAPGHFLAELAEGVRFVWTQRLLRALTLTVLVTNLIEAPFPVVMAVLAREEYGSAADLGLMYGVFGGAALAGALAFGSIGHRLPRRLTLVCCFATLPLVYLTLATLPSLPVALTALALVGLAAGPLNPLLFTVTAEIVPTELRGRVLRLMDKGVVVDVGNDIEGFVPISQLGIPELHNPVDAVKEGQAVDLKVLEVDPIHHRIVLAATNFPPDDGAQEPVRQEPGPTDV
jgi:predicted MFS family arabinose efflux permease